jgi:hypothetical protein
MSTSRSCLAAVAAGFLLVACGGSVGTVAPATVDTSKMMVSLDSTFTRSVPVGSPTSFDIDVKDVGAVDIPNLTVIFDDGDRFMDNYTVQSAGACKVDKGLPGLTCGKVATGADLKVTITAQPSKAGSFVFKFHLANNKQRLHQSDDNEYVYSWTQTVTAA